MPAETLYIVMPCYNESAGIETTVSVVSEKLRGLISAGRIAADSAMLFADDGSADNTWELIEQLHAQNPMVKASRLAGNRGKEYALFAGLMEAKEKCDITVSIDCDGQDDLDAMDKMVEKYLQGCEVVYGVRSDRTSDSFFKRFTAQAFYKLMKVMGAETVYNHADYRLLSARVLREFAEFQEVNLFLRGLIPLVGFQSDTVEYVRTVRLAGESKYPLKKMISLAMDGITSLSIKPLRLITGFGVVVAIISFIGVIWAMVQAFLGNSVAGWASTTCIVCFVSGVQLISLGIIGEYVGKTYMEVKHRPKFIISERTEERE